MPKTGLNVPIVTVLDDAGEVIEADQRRVIQHVIQNGRGAHSVFLSGTTGEFDKLEKHHRQKVIIIGCEEIRTINHHLPPHCEKVEAWAGVTAPSVAETLENLALAGELAAEVAVIAPLAIYDLPLDEIVSFFERDVAAHVCRHPQTTIALYDNPDIAAETATMRNIPVEIVARLNELPFVVCLKASTSRDVLQNYLRVSLMNTAPDALNIYVGNAPLIFEYEEIQRAAGGVANALAIAGVVAGTANLMPCEWRAAWQAVVARDAAALAIYQCEFARFDELCVFGAARTAKGIAAIKRALYLRGIITSPRVAPGTPSLTVSEAAQFDEKLPAFLQLLNKEVGDASLCSR